ncbi:MAG: HisA/HisF-related TIM barrel protein, partial [Alphaproteobacteria bacterium]
MILYPAIDLLDGRVVRLAKGDFAAVTDYGEAPLATARAYAAAGATWLHLVDLSGARDGARRQAATVESINGAGLKVQTGGGVRSAADVQAILDAGAARAVVGSLAVTDPARVTRWLQRFGPDRLTLAFDVTLEQGEARPRVAGWTE